jgi:hypothetical protein
VAGATVVPAAVAPGVISKDIMKGKLGLILLAILISYIAISEMIRYNRNINFDNLAVVIDEINLYFDKLRFSEFECNVGFLTQIEHGNLDRC